MNVFVENNLKRIEKALNHAYNVRNINALGIVSLEDRTQLSTEEVKEALLFGLKKSIVAVYKGKGGAYRLTCNPLKNVDAKPSKKSLEDQRFLNNLKKLDK